MKVRYTSWCNPGSIRSMPACPLAVIYTKNDAFMLIVWNFQETRALVQMCFELRICSHAGKITADIVDTVALLRTCVANFRLCGVVRELKKKKKAKSPLYTELYVCFADYIYERVFWKTTNVHSFKDVGTRIFLHFYSDDGALALFRARIINPDRRVRMADWTSISIRRHRRRNQKHRLFPSSH